MRRIVLIRPEGTNEVPKRVLTDSEFLDWLAWYSYGERRGNYVIGQERTITDFYWSMRLKKSVVNNDTVYDLNVLPSTVMLVNNGYKTGIYIPMVENQIIEIDPRYDGVLSTQNGYLILE